MKNLKSFKLAITIPLFIGMAVLGIFLLVAANKQGSSDIRSKATGENPIPYTPTQTTYPNPDATQYVKWRSCKDTKSQWYINLDSKNQKKCDTGFGTFTISDDGKYTLSSLTGDEWVYYNVSGDFEFQARLIEAHVAEYHARGAMGGDGATLVKLFVRESPKYYTNHRGSMAFYLDSNTKSWDVNGYHCKNAKECNEGKVKYDKSLPLWAKVKKTGKTIEYFTSADGMEWKRIAKFTSDDLPNDLSVGLAIEPYDFVRRDATFDSVSITGHTSNGTTPVPVTETLAPTAVVQPTATLTAGASGVQWWSKIVLGDKSTYVCPPKSSPTVDCRVNTWNKLPIYCTETYTKWADKNCKNFKARR